MEGQEAKERRDGKGPREWINIREYRRKGEVREGKDGKG